ncbi:MAG: class Ib ribonucleoside-diphosphate reductase assembly flavoprotein NrdI [Brevinema sp.]
MKTIYFDSSTGNVQRFINKLCLQDPSLNCIKITPDMRIKESGHLITYTTKIGAIPEVTEMFLKNPQNCAQILSISSSGNRNWGVYYALAANLISDQFGIPIALKFELSGTKQDIENYMKQINYLEMQDVK